MAYFQQNRKQNKVKHVTEWSSLKGMRGCLSGRMQSREIGNERNAINMDFEQSCDLSSHHMTTD